MYVIHFIGDSNEFYHSDNSNSSTSDCSPPTHQPTKKLKKNTEISEYTPKFKVILYILYIF